MAIPKPLKSKPDIRLCGEISSDMFKTFQEQLDDAQKKDGPIVLELTTLGGDAQIGRRMALDIRNCRAEGRETWFLGKTTVYSAGITVMGAFPPDFRYVTRDTVLLIHERRLEKQVDLKDKPLKACAQIIQQLKAQVEIAQEIEKENFVRLAEGTKLSPDELYLRALDNWYLRAEEALDHGLVGGLI